MRAIPLQLEIHREFQEEEGTQGGYMQVEGEEPTRAVTKTIRILNSVPKSLLSNVSTIKILCSY